MPLLIAPQDNQKRQSLAASYAGVPRLTAVVDAKVCILMHEVAEVHHEMGLLADRLRASYNIKKGEKEAALYQCDEITRTLHYGATKGVEYFRRLPALYEALEQMPWADGAGYVADNNYPFWNGDKYQVAVRALVTKNWVKNDVKVRIAIIANNINQQGPDIRLALCDVKALMIKVMIEANGT